MNWTSNFWEISEENVGDFRLMFTEMEAQVEGEKRDTTCGLTPPKSSTVTASYGPIKTSCEFSNPGHLLPRKKIRSVDFVDFQI